VPEIQQPLILLLITSFDAMKSEILKSGNHHHHHHHVHEEFGVFPVP